jgi:hypothetical protein
MRCNSKQEYQGYRIDPNGNGNTPLYNEHKMYARNTPSRPEETSQPVRPAKRPHAVAVAVAIAAGLLLDSSDIRFAQDLLLRPEQRESRAGLNVLPCALDLVLGIGSYHTSARYQNN